MKLKRLFATAISFIIGIAAFAQNSDYSSLLTKAKEYETQNKWVYAAATYFDAMVQNPTAQGIDAYTGFNEILELFYNGNPGKGEFDDFTKADAWLALAKEAEEYFTLNAPFDVQIYYAKGELNTANKTCTYYFAPHIQYSEKAKLIIDAMKTGINQCEGSPLANKWPKFSAYNSSSKTGKAAVTAAVIPASPKALVAYCTLNGAYTSDIYPAGKTYYSPAWAVNYFQYTTTKYPDVRCSFYTLAIDIIDEKGKVIATIPAKRMDYVEPNKRAGGAVTVAEVCYMNILNDRALSKVTVDAAGYKAINEGKYSFRVNSVILNNTDISAKVVSVTKEFLGRKSIQNVALFSESPKNAINVNKDNIRFCEPYNCGTNNLYYLDSALPHKINVIATIKNEAEKILQRKENVEKLRNLTYEIAANDEKVIMYSTQYLRFSNDNTNYDYYIMNLASVEEGLETVYSLNGESDPSKWVESDYGSYEGEITKNENANGYRYIESNEENFLLDQNIINYRNYCKVISGSEKDKYIAEYKAKKEAEELARLEAEKAKQKKIDEALAQIMNPFNEKYLKAPKDYKSLFKNVKGSFTMNIPFIGETTVDLDFYASQIEVTQGLYEKIMGTNPSQGTINELYPVNNVSIYEAIVFCNKLSIAAGLTPAYTVNKTTDPDKWGAIPTKKDAKWDKISVAKKADGFRLPTSDEMNAYTTNSYIDYDKVYYAGLTESYESIKVEGETIYKPRDARANKFELYNANDNILEMFRDSKVCGTKVGHKTGSVDPSSKDPRIGFRVVSGKK